MYPFSYKSEAALDSSHSAFSPVKGLLVPLVVCPLVLGSAAYLPKQSNIRQIETSSTGIAAEVSNEITDADIVETVEWFMKTLVEAQKNLTDVANEVLMRNRWEFYE